MKFIFSHGFGFDSSFWGNLNPYFAEYECIYLDQGYFGEKSQALLLDANSIFIGIGHSFGFSKLLSLPLSFSKLIGLHGFINFLGFNPILHKKREIELERLRRSFNLSPLMTLKNFYHRCGIGCTYPQLSQINKKKLLEDLDNIKQISQLIQIPTLIVGAKDDKIVTEELIYDNFIDQSHVQITFLDQGQHSLGYNKAAEISEIIRNFIN